MARTSVSIPDVSGVQRTALDEIPADVKKYVEDTYKKQRKTPGRERAVYDSEDEMNAEFKLMVDYGAQRPEGKLKIRRSPTRKENLPANLRAISDRVMDWRVAADVEANGKANATRPQGQVAR